jgi:hypothetical protein
LHKRNAHGSVVSWPSKQTMTKTAFRPPAGHPPSSLPPKNSPAKAWF